MKPKPPSLKYPVGVSEFEVQAELYWKLKNEGVHVRGEVRGRVDDFGKRHKTRFDLVVFDRLNWPLVIIECKNTLTAGELKGRQKRRYNMFNLPVILCSNLDCVEESYSRVLAIIEDSMFA